MYTQIFLNTVFIFITNREKIAEKNYEPFYGLEKLLKLGAISKRKDSFFSSFNCYISNMGQFYIL